MSFAVPASRSHARSRSGVATTGLAPGSWRATLQVALGLVWLLDAGLQFQPFMFTRSFVTGIIEPTAAGNPTVVKQPLLWSAHFMLHHIVAYNTVFAVLQLLLAVGILWPRTRKVALGASVVWALGVWWLGEGLGGILASPTSDPFTGAPGAVVLYAFIAVLVWPRDEPDPAGMSVASSGPLGRVAPKVLWLGLWVSFAYMMLQPANRSPSSLGSMVSGMASGEPGWIKSIDSTIGRALSGHGTEVSLVFAVLFVLVGVGVAVPRLARPAVLLAVALGAAVWVGEDFGGIFTSQGTDPNSGLLIMLLAAVFWPTAAPDEAIGGTRRAVGAG